MDGSYFSSLDLDAHPTGSSWDMPLAVRLMDDLFAGVYRCSRFCNVAYLRMVLLLYVPKVDKTLQAGFTEALFSW